MTARRGSALAALVLTGALAWAAPPAALGDGDPASDVLLGQDVFPSYTPISPGLERRLYAVSDAARRAHYPLKIALIDSRSDLGVVPALFGRPEAYARFLSAELGTVVSEPVLVVMPAGVGLASRGRALSTSAVGALRVATGPGGDGADALATEAIGAAERLAAAAGHPLRLDSAGEASASGPGPGTVRHAVTAMLVLAALAAAAISLAFTARRRRRRDAAQT